MTFAIIILGVALVTSLAFNFGFFAKSDSTTSSGHQAPARMNGAADPAPSAKLEGELEKRKRELEDLRRQNAELKDELKQVKKRIFDHKEASKDGDDLVKARADAERQASIQLESTRHELSTALADVQRLKGLLDAKGKKAERPAEARTDEPKKEVVIQKVIRELSDADKEKMARLEQQAASDKKKAIEATTELRNIKGKIDREKREAKRIYEEGRLSRDKFRAVETRLNRTLLEADLLRRALAGLEKKTGQHAEPTQLTVEEIADSDAKMKDKYAAEDKASADAMARLEAAEAKAEELAQTPPAEAPAATAAPETPAAPTA